MPIMALPKTAAADSGRGTGRVLIYKIVLGGYEWITPNGFEGWEEFTTRTEYIAIPDEGPYTPSNTRIDAQVALRFPGFTCLESAYQGRATA